MPVFSTRIKKLFFVAISTVVLAFLGLKLRPRFVVIQLEDIPILAIDPKSDLWLGFIQYLKLNLTRNNGTLIEEDISLVLRELVPLYIITPTYPNPLQKVNLIRTAQALKVSFFSMYLYLIQCVSILKGIPNLLWIVSEDSNVKNKEGYFCQTFQIVLD